jgi:hypothetical protein
VFTVKYFDHWTNTSISKVEQLKIVRLFFIIIEADYFNMLNGYEMAIGYSSYFKLRLFQINLYPVDLMAIKLTKAVSYQLALLLEKSSASFLSRSKDISVQTV